ncbi:hypothetical protein CFC21_063242 [Triticum aestivum]|uniref:DUF4378 domain-containing protein n=7 Tax=Triticinae TaxID=1648030 RepID=A0A9R1GXU7_WHEAT|nr:LOW QUALITY PROTEIN: uncharacterized protein LOC109750337 [Aegilops tauschii subsp. strangulata]XP_044376875.1 uncharacterized protein LOC123098867 [Triticum aestivum]XP_044376876.1 uncharacterized protein LOC123098867 [Triticum aestivum]KAF7028400.1 hypothetical protein CFC21_040333 [Triticum aestivum]KAF7055752.1 hypothetical protein CFC21_063242 [Triticum aestivum]
MMQHLDFSQASTSKKWTANSSKRQPGQGFDAPRNSMEFAMEAPHSYGVFQEDVPYSCNSMRQYPRSSSAPIKKLIHEDASFRPNEGHKRVPSVIARLMGMDSPPMNSELTTHLDDARQGMIVARPVPTKHVSFAQQKNPARHMAKQEVYTFDDAGDDEREILAQLTKRSNGGGGDGWSKLVPREHPQEEELQKFKKEFAAWQASKVWEQSRALELDSRHVDDGDGDRSSEIVPYRYHQQDRKGSVGNRRVHDNGSADAHWRRRGKEGGGGGGPSISGSRTFSLTSAGDGSSARLPLSRFYYEEEEKPLSPTRIVILKPCPELSADDVDESSLGSPELMKNENNMEAFLEEVKMRLKIELEGHMAPDDRAADRWPAGSGDVPADPKQIARNIADQIRESVTKEMHHPALLRSESTRSYRSSDVQSQMDYICRDARKQLSDRLRNVLRREPEADQPPPFGSHRRRPAASTPSSSPWDEEPRPKPTSPRRDVARKGDKKIRSKEEKKRAIESSEVRSFRQGWYKSSATAAVVDSSDESASPRNLMRSFSAPVSGNFVKFLSEGEPKVLAGARVQLKHEGHGDYYGGRPSPEEERAPKGRKDGFGIKGKVSNLRQNLGLRAKLFGKKLHSAAADESSSSFFLDDFPPMGTLVTAPSVLIHPGVLQENSTEVPPSPASWCSSPPDDMMIRGGYPSPVSPLEASFGEHRSPLKPAASSSASEPGNSCLEQDQAEEIPQASPAVQDDDDDDTAEMDHPTKAFIRTVLVVAGMYGQNSGDHLSLTCQPIKPIPKWAFEQVTSSTPPPEAASVHDVDHRLLFDLINEALPGAARGSTTLCVFSKWYAAPPRRASADRRLLDGLWRSVQTWLEPPSVDDDVNSVDGLIGRDMGVSPWSGVFRDDVDGIAEEMEAEILSELVDETLWDVLLNVGD